MKIHHKYPSILLLLMLTCAQLACSGGDNGNSGSSGTGTGPGGTGNLVPPEGSKGLIFVAQTPNPGGTSDIGMHTATFGNSQPGIVGATRGGSLYFLQSDGELRDLLDEALKNGCAAGGDAICDEDGSHTINDDGLLVSGYVVRRPRIHWDADKVMISMVSGAKLARFDDVVPADPQWQLYEISGLDPNDTPLLTRIPNQPDFNNVDAIYGSEGKIFFISDKTVTGNPAHYPQLDEYESLPINTGLWKLDPVTGDVDLMDHSPSGDFGPEITPNGQLLFTRWDHLQRDQQAEHAKEIVILPDTDEFWGPYTYADENDVGDGNYQMVEEMTRIRLQNFIDTGDMEHLHAAADGDEIYPEPVRGNAFYKWENDGKEGDNAGTFVDDVDAEHDIAYTTLETEYGGTNWLRFNHFLPWQIRQDGLQCETYRHTGLHENGGFINRSLIGDPNIRDIETTAVRIPDGFFLNQVHNDPTTSFETVTGVVAPEFGTHKAGRILQFIDTQVVSQPALHENGDAVDYLFLTDPDSNEHLYRDPMFLSDGRLIAAVSRNPGPSQRDFNAFDFRLRELVKNEETGYFEPGQAFLAESIDRNFSFWTENEGNPNPFHFDGALWQIEAQEVIARTEPAIPPEPLMEDPELDAFSDTGVDPDAFREYLRVNNLAAIVIRNATSRDGADIVQPFNLVVEDAGGVRHEQTTSTDFEGEGTDPLYPITYLQLMRGDYLRGYTKFARFEEGEFVSDNGRRVLPRTLAMDGELAHNIDVVPSAPDGAVPIFDDGSIAALVPAHRALTWQITDNDGDPIVRERYWLTFQPGEVRVCASCHGVNEVGQDGNGKPENSPLALRALLEELQDAGEL